MSNLKIRIKLQSLGYAFIISIFCLLTIVLILSDVNKPSYFSLLPILPLVYMISVVLFGFLFDCIPSNFGATLMLIFEGIRMTLTPLFIYLSGYQVVLGRNAEENIPHAIMLMAYECAVVFLVMAITSIRCKGINQLDAERTLPSINDNKYNRILVGLLVLNVLMIIVAPQILSGYRTIFSVNAVDYTSVEMSSIINSQSTGFVSRFAMVLGMNLAIVLRILIPTTIIISLSKRKGTLPWAIIIALTPFLIVDGTIGRSVYFAVSLFYMIFYLYGKNRVKRIFRVALIAAVIFIIVYWGIRYNVSNSTYSFSEYISRILNNYFSGLYMVSGSFNLEANFSSKALYFGADILKSIPFGNSIFRMGNVSYFQSFFNLANGSYGMIPPSIGTGYFYFGPIFAPIYSAIFTAISFSQGDKAIKEEDSYRKITHLICSLFFALSFNMYSIQTTFTLLFWVVVPSMLITRFARFQTSYR